MSKQISKKEWADMTPEEQAQYCQDQADLMGPGFCKDRYLSQAKEIRESVKL